MSTLNLQNLAVSLGNSISEGGCFPRFPRPEPLPFPRPPLPFPFPPGGGSERKSDAQASAVENSQLERIKNGLQDGSLSESEAQRLLQQQAEIAQRLSAARADGWVSPSEQRQIAAMQREAGRDISAAKHNWEFGDPSANGDVVDRQVNQISRIQNGISSGQLTSGETGQLLNEQSNVAGVASLLGADNGGLGLLGNWLVGSMQDNASSDIYNQKHDGQQALPPFRLPWLGGAL